MNSAAPFVGIGRYVRSGAHAHPTRPAVEMADGRARSYAELDERSNRLAHALLGLDCARGERVAIWLGNCLEYLDAYLACAKAGLVVVPINLRFTPTEADHLLADSGASVLVFGTDVAERVQALEARPRLRTLVGVGTASAGVRDLEDLVVAGSASALPEPGPDELLIIGYTSGTTGTPKGAELTHGSVERLALSNALSCRYRLGSVHIFAMNLSFTATVPAHVLPHLVVGGTTILFPSWDSEAMLEVIARRRGNFLIVPSPVLTEFAAAVRARPHTADSLVGALHSASKAPAEHLADLVDALGERVIEGWGMTENSGGLMTASHQGDLVSGSPEALASAGRAVPGAEVIVRDPDADGVGALCVRTPSLFRGYWRNPAATAAAIDPDGWFLTGDLGTVGADGLVTVLDRRADLINSGGMNVYPSEVERVLMDSGLVRECAVVPVAHPRWGQVPVAFVVPSAAAAADPEALAAFAAQRLADYKRPARIEVLDALPRNAGSKVDRRALTERAVRSPR